MRLCGRGRSYSFFTEAVMHYLCFMVSILSMRMVGAAAAAGGRTNAEATRSKLASGWRFRGEPKVLAAAPVGAIGVALARCLSLSALSA